VAVDQRRTCTSSLRLRTTGHAARFLGEAMSITSEPREADVIVAPSHPGIYVDSWMDKLVRYVAPIQMLLDAFGLGEPLAQAGMAEARSW
jgi:hypothetical protein